MNNLVWHVTSGWKSCFFQLRQLELISNFLIMNTAKTRDHAFTISRLYYCNSLLVGAADYIILKLQGVQLITETRKFN